LLCVCGRMVRSGFFALSHKYEPFEVLGYHVGGHGEERFLLGGRDVMVGFDFLTVDEAEWGVERPSSGA
jgi:hypothetical protein